MICESSFLLPIVSFPSKADKHRYAPDVMLACGGFEGNREMLAKYVGPKTHELPFIAPGLKYNKGAGLNMALEVGADTAGSFDGIHSELVDTRATKPDAVIWGHNYGILLNENCERFYDEGNRPLFATFEMAAFYLWRDHNNKGYFVTDSTIMDRFRPGWVYESTDQEPVKANSIRDLALKLGADPEKLEKTVREFNAACDKNKPFDLMKLDGKATKGLKPNKTNWANPIDKPPYYAFPVAANLTFTYGGVKINLDSQVLGTNGVPIPGLYAAGELTGLYINGMLSLPFDIINQALYTDGENRIPSCYIRSAIPDLRTPCGQSYRGEAAAPCTAECYLNG